MDYTNLVNDVTFWISGDSTSTVDYTAADINANLNNYYNEIVSIIMSADGRWEWDDSNLTTLPIATTNMVAGQGDYAVDAADFLNLIRVEIKDSSGDWITIEPMSYEDKQDVTITGLDDTNATPLMYDKVGGSIILHPKPNYSSTAGIKAFYQRTPDYFLTTDTTQAPGFNPLYHRYLSMGAALDFCMINSMDNRVTLLTTKMADIKQMIKDDYSKRSRDEKLRMSVKVEDYGNSRGYTVSPDRIDW